MFIGTSVRIWMNSGSRGTHYSSHSEGCLHEVGWWMDLLSTLLKSPVFHVLSSDTASALNTAHPDTVALKPQKCSPELCFSQFSLVLAGVLEDRSASPSVVCRWVSTHLKTVIVYIYSLWEFSNKKERYNKPSYIHDWNLKIISTLLISLTYPPLLLFSFCLYILM